MRRLVLASALTALAGCYNFSMEDPQVQLQRDFDETIPICDGDADCKAKWEAAQLWVAQHAAYKIQTVTEELIETRNSVDRGLAMRITKEPLGGDRYRIVADAWCLGYSCGTNAISAMVDFNREIRHVTP